MWGGLWSAVNNRSQSLHAQFCERSVPRSLRLPHAFGSGGAFEPPNWFAAHLEPSFWTPSPVAPPKLFPWHYRWQQKSINFAMKFIVSHKVTRAETATATVIESATPIATHGPQPPQLGQILTVRRSEKHQNSFWLTNTTRQIRDARYECILLSAVCVCVFSKWLRRTAARQLHYHFRFRSTRRKDAGTGTTHTKPGIGKSRNTILFGIYISWHNDNSNGSTLFFPLF